MKLTNLQSSLSKNVENSRSGFMSIEEIVEFLEKNSCEQDKEQWIKTIKVHKKVHGVKLAKINPKIKEWKNKADFNDIAKLWKLDKTEARITAIKLLAKIAKKDYDKALSLVKLFVKDLEDWATTDTLATQGIRNIIKQKEDEIKKFANICLKSNNVWIKRFGIVVYINFPYDKKAKQIVTKFSNEKEPYIKKAIEWLKRKLKKYEK